VSAEGLTERVGDILMQCTGLPAGTPFTGNLSVFLPVAVTNRVTAGNTTTDITVSANGTPLAVVGQVNGQTVTFAGLTFPVPASGAVDLKISNLRGAVSQLGGQGGVAVTAGLSFSLPVDRPQQTVAYPQTSLLAAVPGAGIPCTGSSLPATVTFSNLIAAGTSVSSTRATEGFFGAFTPRTASTDSGTRVLLRFTGFPSGSRLFAPDFVAGGDAAAPTRAGDLGGSPAGGAYVPGSGTLLLARVVGADSTGTGGFVLQLPSGSGAVSFDTVGELSVVNGAASVTYEVVDASPAVQQNAQIPVFFGIPSGAVVTTSPDAVNNAGITFAHEQVSLAPLSATATASTLAPVPRYEDDFPPPPDCTVEADCPLLENTLAVFPSPAQLQFTAVAGGNVAQAPGYIAVQNIGNGIMVWKASVQYAANGPLGWITLDPSYPSFVNNASVRVFINSKNLAPGSYQANVVIDATPDGIQLVPVSLVISPTPSPAPSPNPSPNPAPAPQPNPVIVTRIVNAASLQLSPLVPGSLASIAGTNLSGKSVAVAFDGIAPKIVSASTTEIRVVVPPELGAKTSSILVVTVDGASSSPQYVPLAAAWPAIFPNGVLNPDGSVNSSDNPAPLGGEIQIFASGLPLGAGQISVQIHDRIITAPDFAGAAPDSPGMQQVNVVVPDDLPAMTTWVLVCGNVAGGQFCSPGMPLTIH
jgi:uncharacterized protein (TIGR03437 family)